MNYLSFHRAFRDFPVVSIKDIAKWYPDFDSRRLVEWQKKGYILKIRRGYYCFAEGKKDDSFRYFSANKIYPPSYISFESALEYYNFIPEGVFLTTSATTRNTTNYSTPIGDFSYRHMRSSLFFGYRLVQVRGFTMKIAEPEKVVLDYFYSGKINSIVEIEAMRLNKILLKETLDFKKIEHYCKVFGSKIVGNRVGFLKKAINA